MTQSIEPLAVTGLNPDEVHIGTSNGVGIYIAPLGTAGPASTTVAWPTAWHPLGYLSDDGPTVSGSIDTEDLTPWQSVVPIRTVITGRTLTLQFVMWELNQQTLALFFGGDVDFQASGADINMDIRSDEPAHEYAVGIDSRDGNSILRINFLRATLSDSGDMQIQRGAVVPLDVTLSALDYGGVLGHITKAGTTGASPLLAAQGNYERATGQ
jgi:hypothetical protein